MLDNLAEAGPGAVDIISLRKADLAQWQSSAAPEAAAWARANGFSAEAGSCLPVPGPDGSLALVLAGRGEDEDCWAFAGLAAKLPAGGTYRIASKLEAKAASWAALSWALADYTFSRYKTRPSREYPRLVWPAGADREWVSRNHDAIRLVRDLINTPASDMGPAELSGAAETLAARFGATVRVIVGDGLLAENYPAIHTVGRAAAAHRQPRLIDMAWGDASAPRVTLVGKGVCFDTGGLDLKTSANMKLMKKDMGGAANVLGLASMIMEAALPVRLRVLIPAVENSVSGNAMRPMDVITMRKGNTVEVGNTDAEGRLILADALWAASDDKPDLLIDMATLTGAARTALGVDLPALFSNNDLLAGDLMRAGETEADPLWRLPLHKPYRRMLDSKVADLNNVSDGPHAGAITAALFLQEFVAPGTTWAHLDIFGWNPAARPGRPDGGEAMGIRALYSAIEARFHKSS